MTDPFEDAVRAAGRGLASVDPVPTYHGAWKRGRRRRLAKRSAVAVAGACALVVAFGADLGRLQGGGPSIETDDLALQAEPVPSPVTPVATTPPVTSVPGDGAAAAAAPDLDLEAEPGPTSAAATNAPSTPAPLEPTVDAQPTRVPTPTGDGPTPAPTAAEPAATVAADPTATVAAQPTAPDGPSTSATLDEPAGGEAGDDGAASTGSTDNGSTGTGSTGTDSTGTDSTDNGSTGTGSTGAGSTGIGPGGDDGAGTGLAETPGAPLTTDAPPASRLGLPADAVIAPDAARNGTEATCDVDFDGTADAYCQPLPMYRCNGPDEVRDDYQALDLDGDQLVDTCVAVVQTTCDTTGDGIGDVSCLIRLAADAKNLEDEGP